MQDAFEGSTIDDREILTRLPSFLAEVLQAKNGFVSGDMSLHVRGACNSPAWHSLRLAWEGPQSLHELFPAVQLSDVPIAEDCFGDQYLVREQSVVHLSGETGEITILEMGWEEFITHAKKTPLTFLGVQELERFQQEGGILRPGQALSVYPPFVTRSVRPRSLRAISALEHRSWLADFARQISSLKDGATFRIETIRPEN